MKWPLEKIERDSGSSDQRWGSVCTWSRLRVQTCWAGWASRWGCTWCCTCWAHPGWWSLWHSPGKGTAGSGQGMLAGCLVAGYPPTRWRCPARGQIPHLSSQSWCGVLPDRGQMLAGSCWDRNSPNWSRSAQGTPTGTCWSPLEAKEQDQRKAQYKNRAKENISLGFIWNVPSTWPQAGYWLCGKMCHSKLQNGSWVSGIWFTAATTSRLITLSIDRILIGNFFDNRIIILAIFEAKMTEMSWFRVLTCDDNCLSLLYMMANIYLGFGLLVG